MTSMMVNVSEVPVLDAMLERGEPAEPVNCQCRIGVTTSSTSTLVDAKTITAVPLTTRNFTQVLSMSSGSAADVNNAGTLGRGTRNVNVNGNTTAGAYTLDGAYAPSAVPNPDTIAELKIQTSQYDAVYGAQVPNTDLITKSGENDFHGDAWEFVRNDVFNANSFFRGSTGQPKPNLKQNQFGATHGRSRQAAEAVLLRLLPGNAAGERRGHYLHVRSHPAATDRGSIGGNPGRPVLSRQSPAGERPARPAVLDLCRREAARLPQSKHGHHRAHQSRGAAPSSDEDARRRVPHPRAADDSHHRRQRRPGLLFLQPSLHLPGGPLPHQRRLSGDAKEHAFEPRCT